MDCGHREREKLLKLLSDMKVKIVANLTTISKTLDEWEDMEDYEKIPHIIAHGAYLTRIQNVLKEDLIPSAAKHMHHIKGVRGKNRND